MGQQCSCFQHTALHSNSSKSQTRQNRVRTASHIPASIKPRQLEDHISGSVTQQSEATMTNIDVIYTENNQSHRPRNSSPTITGTANIPQTISEQNSMSSRPIPNTFTNHDTPITASTEVSVHINSPTRNLFKASSTSSTVASNFSNVDDSDDSSEDSSDSSISSPPPLPPTLMDERSCRPPTAIIRKHANRSYHQQINSDSTTATTFINDQYSASNILPNTNLAVAKSMSKSIFDDVNRRVNQHPSFQRQQTNVSIATLSSINSLQSINSSHLGPNGLSSNNGLSLHSLHSLHSINSRSLRSNRSSTGVHGGVSHSTPNANDKTTMLSTPYSASYNHHLHNMDTPNSTTHHLSAHMQGLSNSTTFPYAPLPNLRGPVDPSDYVQKRVLFVSLIQFYRSYVKGIPSFILHNSLCLFGVKKIWILPQTKEDEAEAAKAYTNHFRGEWKADFLSLIQQKEEQGHVLWIEPCKGTFETMACWNKISDQLSRIVDLSVPEEETNRKRAKIEYERRQNIVRKPIDEVRKASECTLPSTQTSENLGLSDIYHSIASNTQTATMDMDQSSHSMDIALDAMMATHLEPIQSAESAPPCKELPKRASTIADELLKIHTAKSSGQLIEPVHAQMVFLETDDDDEVDDDDDDDGNIVDVDDTDSDFGPDDDFEEEPNEMPETQTRSRPSMTNLHIDSSGKMIIKQTASKQTIKVDEEVHYKLSVVNDDDGNSIMDIAESEYMPYYAALRVDKLWWTQKYEPNRQRQNENEKRNLAEKNPHTFPSLNAPSPHHNESINLFTHKSVKSLYNVQANDVLEQLECIEDAKDIKLKPIKELFFQSNPSLLPMEFFDVQEFIDAHINDQSEAYKYFDIIQYCNANFVHAPTPTMAMIKEKSCVSSDSEKSIDIDTLKLERSGFKMLDVDSEPIKEEEVNDDIDLIEANVDKSGMVYLFDYIEIKDEHVKAETADVIAFERMQLIETMSKSISSLHSRYPNLSATQSSINSVKSDSNLPFGGKFNHGTSDSSIMMFE